jgi:hypothetical protein
MTVVLCGHMSLEILTPQLSRLDKAKLFFRIGKFGKGNLDRIAKNSITTMSNGDEIRPSAMMLAQVYQQQPGLSEKEARQEAEKRFPPSPMAD